MTIASLSDSEEEKFALAVQLATSQPIGTWSGKQYLWQYDQIPDESGINAPIQAPVPKDKEKQKEIWFDKS